VNNTSDLELAKFSVSRTGYKLVDVKDAVLPYYMLTAEVFLIERRPLGPLEEFVLKAIDSEFSTIKEISGILGLEEKLIMETIVSLVRADCVLQVQVGERYQELRLTAHGARTLETELREAPAKEEVKLYFNRLRWIVEPASHLELLRPKEVAEQGIWEIKALKQKKPTVQDLDLDDLQTAVRKSRKNSRAISVLVVNQILRTERFFLPVQIGVFRSIEGEENQITILVDGRVSEGDESALESLGGLTHIGAQVLEPELLPNEALAADYGVVQAKELLEQAPPRTDRVTRSNQVIVDEISDSVEPELILNSISVNAKPAVTTSAIQFIDTYEHREYLNLALTKTANRLVIMSPWIAASVVNQGFLEQLSQLLRRKVRVHIGYGLEQRPGERFTSKADEAAEEALRKMSNRYDNFVFTKLGNTHSKQLLFDDTHISGSFNWLSFQGAKHKQYRHEESTVVRIKSKVDAKYLDLCKRINEQKY